MVLSWLADMATTVLGSVLPAFYTFKSLRYVTKKENRDQQVYWLKYWAVYALLSAVEGIAEKFFLTYLVPGYAFLKLGYTLWSVLPFTRGAEIIYDRLLAPEMRRHEMSIDRWMEEATSRVRPLAFKTVAVAGNAFLRAFTAAIAPTTWRAPQPVYVHQQSQFGAAGHRLYAANAIEELDEEEEEDRPGPSNHILTPRQVKVEPEDTEDDFEVIYENIVTPPRAPGMENGDNENVVAPAPKRRAGQPRKQERAAKSPTRRVTRSSARRKSGSDFSLD